MTLLKCTLDYNKIWYTVKKCNNTIMCIILQSIVTLAPIWDYICIPIFTKLELCN